MNVELTILIPNLNQASKLKMCLRSLNAQITNNDPIEVLVVDNGSEDDSITVAQELGAKVLIFDEKKNPYSARNYGIKHAQGFNICFIDSKCLPANNFIKNLLKLHSAGEFDLVGGRFKYLGLTKSSTISELAYSVLFLKTNPKYFNGNVSALTGNMIARKSLFSKVGFFLEKRSRGDVEFTERTREQGFIVKFAQDLICYYTPLGYKDLLRSITRNQKDAISQMSISGLKPPNFFNISNRLSDEDITLPIFKFLTLYFFIWGLRFYKYFKR